MTNAPSVGLALPQNAYINGDHPDPPRLPTHQLPSARSRGHNHNRHSSSVWELEMHLACNMKEALTVTGRSFPKSSKLVELAGATPCRKVVS